MPRLKSKYHLITENSSDLAAAEAYRKLRTTIDYSHADEGVQTIMVTSAVSGEGKSTTAANLSLAYALCSKRVLLVDADMHRPAQHQIFNAGNESGLSTLLAGQTKLHEVLIPVNDGTFTLLPAGPASGNPAELLASPAMSSLLEELKRQFDLVIIDTPALLAVSDAQIMAAKCDGVVLVARPGKVKREAAAKARESLQLVKARVLGAVLNQINRKNAGRYMY